MRELLDFPNCALVVVMNKKDAIRFAARMIHQDAWFFCEQHDATTSRFYVAPWFYPMECKKVFKGLRSVIFVKLYNPKL